MIIADILRKKSNMQRDFYQTFGTGRIPIKLISIGLQVIWQKKIQGER